MHINFIWHNLIYAGNWRAGAALAQPPDSAGVHGPETGTSHETVPPHWEGQAGILSAVCDVAEGEVARIWLHLFCEFILWKALYSFPFWLFLHWTLSRTLHIQHETNEATFPGPWVKMCKEQLNWLMIRLGVLLERRGVREEFKALWTGK